VIHGDVKPENIMVLPDERVKILDFGLARQMAAETLTVTHTFTHAWLPESHIERPNLYQLTTPAFSQCFILRVRRHGWANAPIGEC
jgi:serine/threonine protein kinase